MQTGGGGAEAVLGEAVLLSLRKDSRVRVGRTAGPVVLELERGALFVESPGEPVLLRMGDLRAEFLDATLAAETGWDGRDGMKVTALRGSVALSLGIEARTLDAGQSMRVVEGVLEVTGAVHCWTGDQAWSPAGEAGLIRDGSRSFLSEPSQTGYVFEALIRKRSASAEAGLLFQAGGKSWLAPVGEGFLPEREGWCRVRITVAPDACRITLGMREFISCRVQALDSMAQPAAGKDRGVGFRAWGGDLEVSQPRWRRGGSP